MKELLDQHEEDLKTLWKQRDKLLQENTDYEVKCQHLDEQLRLVTRYKDCLERNEFLNKAEIRQLRGEIGVRDDRIDRLQEDVIVERDLGLGSVRGGWGLVD